MSSASEPRWQSQPAREASETVVYVYSFQVWPDETWNFDKAVFDLFRMLATRVEMNYTRDEFESFRSSLSRHGITMREIERVPYAQPEPVY